MYLDDLMQKDPARLRLLLGGLRTRLANTRELAEADVQLVRWLVMRTCDVLERQLVQEVGALPVQPQHVKVGPGAEKGPVVTEAEVEALRARWSGQ